MNSNHTHYVSEDNWRANVIWFNHVEQCFGVVRTRDPHTNEVKYYIGVGNGIDEVVDYERIKAWGATFPPEAGYALFNREKMLDVIQQEII